MATRLYMRQTTANVAGYAQATKSLFLPGGTMNDQSFTPRDLSTTIGAGGGTDDIAGLLAQTARQDTYVRKWISDVISSGNITAQTWTGNLWGVESSSNANNFWALSIYVLTSADAVRGYIYDSASALSTELSTTPATARNFTIAGAAVTGVLSTDRIAVEVWTDAIQSMASATTFNFNYDSTVATLAESWIETPQALTFGGGAAAASLVSNTRFRRSLLNR